MKRWTGILACCLFLVAGCGGEDENKSAEVGSLAGIAIVAGKAGDRDIAIDLRKYMVRNCPGPDYELPENLKDRYAENHGQEALEAIEKQLEALERYCAGARSIEVKNRRIVVRSDLKSDDSAAGEAFCSLVQGSDVADPTPFHTLLDETGQSMKVCGTRNAYR